MTRRVLRVITRLTVSGPSTHVLLANRGLDGVGWETLLVHGSVEADEQELELSSPGIAIQRVAALRRQIRPADDARALAELARVMRSFRPDVVHTHQSKAGLLGRIAATSLRRPVRVHTFHGTVFDGYFGPRKTAAIVRAERSLARVTSRLVVLSEAQRAELAHYGIGRPGQVEVVPLGLDLERYASSPRGDARVALGLELQGPVILAVGRFAPIKRLDRLLRIFALVHAARPDAYLCLIGDGPSRPDLEQQVQELGVADSVRFVGWTDRMPEWYAAADIVVNTSDSEGTPLALIEAASSRRPVVAGRVGGIPDVVEDGRTGLLADPDDEAGLAHHIVRLAADPALRSAMGTAAATSAQRFAGTRLVADLDRLYGMLLDGAPAPT